MVAGLTSCSFLQALQETSCQGVVSISRCCSCETIAWPLWKPVSCGLQALGGCGGPGSPLQGLQQQGAEEDNRLAVLASITFAEFACQVGDVWQKKSKHAKMPAAVMSEEAREVMRARLGPEYEVYHYVRERLSRQYIQCQTENKNK